METVEFKINKRDGIARVGILKNHKKRMIPTPISWFGLSVIESYDFQYNAFRNSKVEAFLGNAFDYLIQDKKNIRLSLTKTLIKEGFLFKCDSGGFQKSKKNINLNVEEIYKIQKELNCDIAVQLDFPFNLMNLRDAKKRLNITIENFKKLMTINNNELTILPVIHGYNEKLIDYGIKEIEKILDDEPSIIGIGSLVPLSKTTKGTGLIGGKKKIVDIILYVRKKLPNTFLHIFGVGGSMSYLATFCGADSFDFTGWIIKAGFGVIQLPGISDRFISKHPHRRSLNKEEWDIFMKCKCPICKEYEKNEIKRKRIDFSGNSEKARYRRAVHNLWVFQSEINEMRLSIKRGTFTEFIFERMKNSNLKKLFEYATNKIENI
ncbi:MAG: tRNA-guanine transglycosylase [Candidatus Helarchaeota archaeon]